MSLVPSYWVSPIPTQFFQDEVLDNVQEKKASPLTCTYGFCENKMIDFNYCCWVIIIQIEKFCSKGELVRYPE
jgi:hypothetical protein